MSTEKQLTEEERQLYRDQANTQMVKAQQVRDNAERKRKEMQKLLDLATHLENEALKNHDHAFRGMA